MKKWFLLAVASCTFLSVHGEESAPVLAKTSISSAFGAFLGTDVSRDIARFGSTSVTKTIRGFIQGGGPHSYSFKPQNPIMASEDGKKKREIGSYRLFVTSKKRVYKIEVELDPRAYGINDSQAVFAPILKEYSARYGKLDFKERKSGGWTGERMAELVDPRNPKRFLRVRMTDRQMWLEYYAGDVKDADSKSTSASAGGI